MRNDNLKIGKTILPIGWNPNEPGAYNEWMQMIVQENFKNSSPALEMIQGFSVPRPRFISEIVSDSFKDSMQEMDTLLESANLIIEGGER